MGKDTSGVFIGKSCDRLQKAVGTSWREKANEACTGCMKCFPKNTIDFELIERVMAGGDIEQLSSPVAETANLISLANCGIAIDWASKPFWKFQLFQAWRDCEKEAKLKQEAETSMFQKSILSYLGFK